jgi:hypothetical protein
MVGRYIKEKERLLNQVWFNVLKNDILWVVGDKEVNSEL